MDFWDTKKIRGRLTSTSRVVRYFHIGIPMFQTFQMNFFKEVVPRLVRLERVHFTLLSVNKFADIANKTLFACCRSTAAKVLRQTHFYENLILVAVSDWLPSNLHFTRANLKVSLYPLVRLICLYFSHYSFIGFGFLIYQCALVLIISRS